jgi:hypothetical protein
VLPDSALQGGIGDGVIVTKQGHGSERLGTFRISKSERIYVQLACFGPPPLTLLPLMDAGPCNDPKVVNAANFKNSASTVTLTIKAAPSLRWVVYISQPS